MAKFFVGQRVKVARLPGANERVEGKCLPGKMEIGDEGTVLGTDSRPNAGFVFADHPRVSVYADKLGAHGMAPESIWEPILPEGAAPSEFTTLHDLLSSLEGVAA